MLSEWMNARERVHQRGKDYRVHVYSAKCHTRGAQTTDVMVNYERPEEQHSHYIFNRTSVTVIKVLFYLRTYYFYLRRRRTWSFFYDSFGAVHVMFVSLIQILRNHVRNETTKKQFSINYGWMTWRLYLKVSSPFVVSIIGGATMGVISTRQCVCMCDA